MHTQPDCFEFLFLTARSQRRPLRLRGAKDRAGAQYGTSDAILKTSLFHSVRFSRSSNRQGICFRGAIGSGRPILFVFLRGCSPSNLAEEPPA
ncbi:hypothetical protein CDAR_508621 [Caerostris darwini]|uniref:Uncharacterized protein n=1 Tax=Caerostris darwini TaxID=1538125 RepID=A0AAV4N0B0_9ARAC|nr:hypothetical protein CDAR_508621 [Caerostris darwini]